MIHEADMDGARRHRLLILARVVLLSAMASLLALWIVNLPEYVERITTLTIDTYSQAGEVVASNDLVYARIAGSGLTLQGYAFFQIGQSAFQGFVFWFIALLIMWRADNRWFGWFTALVLAGLGAVSLLEVFQITQPSRLALGAVDLLSWIIWPLMFVWLYLFPSGSTSPRWAWRLTAILMTIFGGLAIRGFLAARGVVAPDPLDLQVTIGIPIGLVAIGLVLYAQVYRFRRVYSVVERQQVKWFLFGMMLLALEIAVFVVVPPDKLGFYAQLLSGMLLLTIPISIGIAIMRYRLFDIDVIIRRTTSYAILSGILLMVYFGSILVLQRLLSPFTGESTIAVVLSTLLIAALFLPLRRRVQNAIDRRFFRQKYDAERVLERFAATVRDETDLDALTAELLRVIQETMQPASVSVWLAPITGDEKAGSISRNSGL